MNKIDSVSFKGFYYTKIPLVSNEIGKVNSNDAFFNSIIEKNPPALLKNVIENSLFFKDFSAGTDVFVSYNLIKDKKPFLGIIKAIFKDPYTPLQKNADEVNIQTVGFSENIIFEKFKHIIDNLPCYNKLKGNNNAKSLRTLGDKFSSSDGYITVGF